MARRRIFYGDRYHSMLFGDHHTYNDWSLVPTSRPLMPKPEVSPEISVIPGSNTVRDYTDIFAPWTGDSPLGLRSASFEFQVTDKLRDWASLYDEISAAVHNKRLNVVLLDEPTWYYPARCWVNEWKSEAHHSLIVIDVMADPYKLEIDPVEREFSAEGTYNLKGYRMPVIPEITVDSRMTVSINGHPLTLDAGTYTDLNDFQLREGDNPLVVSGSGNLSVRYLKGAV